MSLKSESPDAWKNLKEEDLLEMRICDLGLQLEGSALEERVSQVRGELKDKGLRLEPKMYLGDEWFSPEGMVAIAIPFYLAHPRLVELERKQMLDVEGELPEHFSKLLRHEAGHCFDHAYGFSRRSKWQKIFGPHDLEYSPETYRPRPYSRSFVSNLDNWYAQAHPDEDFAETFAVWLDPNRDWKSDYKMWPVALKKVQYVDRLVREVKAREPKGEGGYLPSNANKLQTTLKRYYQKRRREQADAYPDFYDEDLRHIFNAEKVGPRRDTSAAGFLQKNRRAILNGVAHWTGERKFTVESLMKKFIDRCQKLDLRVSKNSEVTHFEVASYLASLVMHYQFTGKFKRTV